MQHTLTLDKEGYLEIHYIGDVSREENLKMVSESYNLTTQLIDQGNEVKLLVDFTQVKNIDPKVTVVSPKALRDGEFKKIAAYGAPTKELETILHNVQSVLENEMHIHNKAAIFKTKEEAINWLKD